MCKSVIAYGQTYIKIYFGYETFKPMIYPIETTIVHKDVEPNRCRCFSSEVKIDKCKLDYNMSVTSK